MTNTQCLDYFARLIEQHTGIVYTEVTYFQLQNRLINIATLLQVGTVEDLWKKALAEGVHGSFKDLLLDLATNNETSFFRDPGVFTAITGHFLPQWLRSGGKNLRIWSAASSTGQEIYSLAMCLQEIQDNDSSFTYDITATDISERVLAIAKAGCYTQLEVQRGVTAPRLVRFFKQIPDGGEGRVWEVVPAIKRNLQFSRINLIDALAPSWGGFDLILCRNVLIYQSVDQKKKVISNLHRCLNPGGYLVLGGAESLVGLSEDFEQVPVGGSIFYQARTITSKAV